MLRDLLILSLVGRRRLHSNHPEVQFKPGPFYMGDGWFGWFVNVTCIAQGKQTILIYHDPSFDAVSAIEALWTPCISTSVRQPILLRFGGSPRPRYAVAMSRCWLALCHIKARFKSLITFSNLPAGVSMRRISSSTIVLHVARSQRSTFRPDAATAGADPRRVLVRCKSAHRTLLPN